MPFEYSQNLEKLSKTKTWLSLQVLAKPGKSKPGHPPNIGKTLQNQDLVNLLSIGKTWENQNHPFPVWAKPCKTKPTLPTVGKTVQNQNHHFPLLPKP
jgi:hypothetical protein